MENKKRRATKSLALVGLIGVLILLAWASVQIVHVAPSAFSALVSITNRVYGPADDSENYELITTISQDIVASGDVFTINWNNVSQTGTYSFTYECQPGVAFSITSSEDDIKVLPCDTVYDLGTSDSVTLTGTSEQRRFTDVPFAITFTPNAETQETVVSSDLITLTNSRVSPIVEITNEEDGDAVAGDTTEEAETSQEPQGSNTEIETSPETYTNTTPNMVPTRPARQVVDLVTGLGGVGTLENGSFSNQGEISAGDTGAVQFYVVNEGTVSSNTWTYIVNLPGEAEYISTPQTPLQPGSTARLTFGFEAPENTGTYPFSLTVISLEDIDQSSNIFDWSVRIE